MRSRAGIRPVSFAGSRGSFCSADPRFLLRFHADARAAFPLIPRASPPWPRLHPRATTTTASARAGASPRLTYRFPPASACSSARSCAASTPRRAATARWRPPRRATARATEYLKVRISRCPRFRNTSSGRGPARTSASTPISPFDERASARTTLTSCRSTTDTSSPRESVTSPCSERNAWPTCDACPTRSPRPGPARYPRKTCRDTARWSDTASRPRRWRGSFPLTRCATRNRKAIKNTQPSWTWSPSRTRRRCPRCTGS